MRYLPHSEADRRAMLAAIGAGSIDDLFIDVPRAAWRDEPLDLPPHRGEIEVERAIAAMARRNRPAGDGPFFCGAGVYRHHVPATVDHLIQRGEFLTSYTPYQPEVAQGTLQYLFEFQTQVALLTGMEVANASLYDGSTGTAEAMLMARRVTRRNGAVLSGGLHPMYRAVGETHAEVVGMAVDGMPADPDAAEDLAARIDGDTACVIVQNPGFFGHVRDLAPLAAACREKGALLVVVVTEVVSLGLIRSPGEMGADIVVAEGQSLGNAMNFGGPHVGLFATRDKFVRQMPGRLAGETVDAEGKRGFVLTLSTREQHIRREKATSNICTNAGLCALAFTIHLSLLGETGLRRLAAVNHGRAVQLAERLGAVGGLRVLPGAFFNEIAVDLGRPAAPIVDALAARDILAGVPVSRLLPGDPAMAPLLLLAATELTTDDDVDTLGAALEEAIR